MSMDAQGQSDQVRRPNRRQFLLGLVGLGAAAVPGLVACGAPNPAAETTPATAAPAAATEAPQAAEQVTAAPAAASDAVNITVMYYEGEFSNDEVNLFMEQNPGIKAERIEWDETKFKALLAAGTPPDVFRTDAFALPNLAEQNLLLDVTSYMNASTLIKPEDLAPANRYYNYKGKTYGMAKDWSPEVSLFAFTTAYEEAGLPAPDPKKVMTYQELAEVSQRLTKREGDRTIRMGYGYDQAWLSRMLSNILIEQDERLYTDDFTRIVLTENPAAVEGLRWFHDLSKADATWNPLNPSPSWIGEDFSKGQLGLVAYGYWYVGFMKQIDVSAVEGNIMMLPAASWTGTKRVNPTVTATGTVIAQATPQPEASWKLLEYFSAGEPAKNRTRAGFGLPALKSLYELLPKETPFERQALEVTEDEAANAADYVVEVNPYYQDSVFTNSWTTNLEQALRGSITFDQLVANLESEVNAAIDDGRAAIGA
jgi:multiple sugar transport system substrate-binding protein